MLVRKFFEEIQAEPLDSAASVARAGIEPARQVKERISRTPQQVLIACLNRTGVMPPLIRNREYVLGAPARRVPNEFPGGRRLAGDIVWNLGVAFQPARGLRFMADEIQN